MSPLNQLATNRVLWCAFAAWLAAQLIKTIRSLIRTRRLDLGYITASGGMPSSHSALVVGLATAVGRLDGMHSTNFAVAAVLASVVMYDAAGVRLAVSKQAKILNLMLEDFFHHERGFSEQRLHELIGHTPVQVFAGAVIGIVFGLLFTL